MNIAYGLQLCVTIFIACLDCRNLVKKALNVASLYEEYTSTTTSKNQLLFKHFAFGHYGYCINFVTNTCLGQAKLIIRFLFQGFQNSMRAGGHFSLFIITKILIKQCKKPH